MYILIYIIQSLTIYILLYTVEYVYLDEFWYLFSDDSDRWSKYIGIVHSYLIPINSDTTLRLTSILFSIYDSYISNLYYLGNISNDYVGLVFLSNECIYLSNYIIQMELSCIATYY